VLWQVQEVKLGPHLSVSIDATEPFTTYPSARQSLTQKRSELTSIPSIAAAAHQQLAMRRLDYFPRGEGATASLCPRVAPAQRANLMLPLREITTNAQVDAASAFDNAYTTA
jgi:hypothetical protein